MKRTKLIISFVLVCVVEILGGLPLRGGGEPVRVWFSEDTVLVLRGDRTTLLTHDIQLPNNITVSTNGTYQVGSYPPRRFVEGQILGSDGMLLSPDGTLEPVIDHLGMLAGSTFSAENGDRRDAKGDLQLGTEKVLTHDRVLLGSDGSWMRVIDGMLFAPDGKIIPALDSITLQQGKVIVQKEGTPITIQPGRSLMMNEGTKVYGDGRIVDQAGQVTHLKEGQIILIEGVVKRR